MGGKGTGRSQCGMEMGKSLYRPLVTASEDEDVNCCVTSSQQGTEQALLCGLQSNLISNPRAISAQIMQSWVCLCTFVSSSPE